MKILKPIVGGLGIVIILMGLLWIGQGLNIIQWPASSFMIGVPTWSWRGLALAALGIGMVIFSRRR